MEKAIRSLSSRYAEIMPTINLSSLDKPMCKSGFDTVAASPSSSRNHSFYNRTEEPSVNLQILILFLYFVNAVYGLKTNKFYIEKRFISLYDICSIEKLAFTKKWF